LAQGKIIIFFPLYYSYSRLLQEAWGNHSPRNTLYYLRSRRLHSSYSPLPRQMPLQLEVLPCLAARWGEGASILVAAGAAAFFMLECLCGKRTPSWSGIMILRRRWLPRAPPPPRNPCCHRRPSHFVHAKRVQKNCPTEKNQSVYVVRT
jgi:hypothetical protein